MHSAVVETTHLVANSVLRTVKFLTALAVVQYVVTSEWIEQSTAADHFLGNTLFLYIFCNFFGCKPGRRQLTFCHHPCQRFSFNFHSSTIEYRISMQLSTTRVYGQRSGLSQSIMVILTLFYKGSQLNPRRVAKFGYENSETPACHKIWHR